MACSAPLRVLAHASHQLRPGCLGNVPAGAAVTGALEGMSGGTAAFTGTVLVLAHVNRRWVRLGTRTRAAAFQRRLH